MKTIYSIFMMIMVADLAGQQNTPIGITFGTSSYLITDVKACDALTAAASDDLAFFHEHFTQHDYQKYRSYYYNNSCLASEQDFANWISGISSAVVTPVTRYLVNSATDTFSIISYSITRNELTQYFPLALQRKNGRWYLLDLRKSEETMNMKMFFTFANAPFLKSFLEEPDKMKERYMSTIFTGKGNLNGDLLMNYYADRYNSTASHYVLSIEVFHGIAVISDAALEKISIQIHQLTSEYQINAGNIKLLDNMCAEGNYNMALSKIAEWSGTSDVIEITDKFHSALKAAAQKN